MVKRILPAALLFLTAALLTAEGSMSMDMGLNNAVFRTRDASGSEYWSWAGTGSAAMSFGSEGSRNVKGEFAFSYLLPELMLPAALTGGSGPIAVAFPSIDRAWIKVRFPWFRITAGKTRLGWGDGFVFNSGDIIFGSTGTGVDLTAAEIRTETGWLTSVMVPLDRFSFVEALAMPPASDGLLSGDITKASAGGRIYLKLAGIKTEAGYFYDGGNAAHKPYIGLQGNLLADWYAAASASFDGGDAYEDLEDSLNISFGLFYMHGSGQSGSLSLRLEGLVRPFGLWSEQSPDSGSYQEPYGILLYPDVSWAVNETLTLSARSIFSPVDLSALASAGAAWNVMQGLTLSTFVTVLAGDPDDSFSWKKSEDLWQTETDRIDGIAVTAGFKYVY